MTEDEEITLPGTANLLKIAAARSVEIKAMTENLLKPSTTRRIFQTLPVHMRRRVMSHNCKRLPKRLRDCHMEQIKKSGVPPKQKRNSRKHRRRPRNLLKEYERRKRNKVWLETHIWHAKRFFMTERWGYKLPERPCDKSFRACYRASSKHCLIQDISYMACLQISGDIDILAEGFKKLTSPTCGLSLCAKAYSSGTKEGKVHIFKESRYPFDYIGSVGFIWQPNNELAKSVWLFVHPAYYKEVLDEIIKTFMLSERMDTSFNFTTFANKNVELLILKDFFNKFRLTGPNSHPVLLNTLKCLNESEEPKWLENRGKLYLEEKRIYWEKLTMISSPAELPPSMTLGLIVHDPRTSIPQKRTKAERTNGNNLPVNDLLKAPPFAKESPMWLLHIFDNMSRDRKSTAEIIKYKTEHQLIPGCPINNFQSIPIMLIQKPGSQTASEKKIGYGSGWDIIIPNGYGLAFWHSFILNGARAGGLRDEENVLFESGKIHLPPDTTAGRIEAQRMYNEKRERYFRLPPNKRVNYIKIAINSPFICQWNVLLEEWIGEKIETFYVLRDKSKLQQLQQMMQSGKLSCDLKIIGPCLVPVYIEVTKRGNISENAIICMRNDMDSLEEPIHADSSKIRKQLRVEHRNKIKAERNKRKKLNMKLRELGKSRLKERTKPKRDISEYMLKMRELWLPENVAAVRRSCSKEVVGYVTKGAFTFTEGKCCGIGFVVYNALIENIEQRLGNQFLIRNTTSKLYKPAQIRIIVE